MLIFVNEKKRPAHWKRRVARNEPEKMRLGSELVRSGNCIHIHTTALTVESHQAVNQSKYRVVFPEAHAFSGQKLGTALTNDDVSSNHRLAAKLLHTEPLAYTVTAVFD
ncbi:MAG: hypothetical protein RLZZ399_2604 [Verrucomicrobiota bacterium]